MTDLNAIIEKLGAPTPQEFAAEMQRLRRELGGDPESVHGQMDELMLKTLRALGYGAGCDVFEATEMWYA